MEHEKDPEYDDFDALIDRHASAGDTEWKQKPSQAEKSELQKTDADDAVDTSANDTKSAETLEQVRLAESASAFDADNALSEFTDAELELIQASQGPTPESNPELLAELLKAQMAEQMVEKNTIVRIPIVDRTPTILTTDGHGNGTGSVPANPGWIISRWKSVPVPPDSKQAEELDEIYRRALYDIDQLTLEQICEVADKAAFEVLKQQRVNAAAKQVGTQRIKDMHAAGKLSAKQRKMAETDLASPPGSFSELQTKKVRRSSPSVASGPKLVSATDKKMVDTMIANGFEPSEVAKKLSSKGKLTAEIGVYIQSLEVGK